MEAIKNIKMSKKLLAEIGKIKSDYGNNVDKYGKSVRAAIELNWYYGHYGSSSTYDIMGDLDKKILNQAASSFLTRNFNEVMKEVAKIYKEKAIEELPNLLKQKELIEELIGELKWNLNNHL